MSDPSDSEIRLPAGVRDFLPRAAARRRAIAEQLLAEFELRGYQRILTPIFECADVLERGLGDGARAAAVRFVEPGSGEVVALRPDITPQIARVVATRFGHVAGPLRLCYDGTVTRVERRFGPGQREILQAGIELCGVPAPDGDAEALAVAGAALAAMEVAEVSLDVGHVALARLALAAVADRAQRDDLATLLAAKDRRGVARTAARGQLPDDARAVLTALPTLLGTPAAVLARARALPLPPAGHAALAELEAVLALSSEENGSRPAAPLTLDLGEVRGFDYYTGIRFAGYVAGVGEPVLRGGRYDELIGRYGRPMPATGFAVDVEAVAQAQRAAGVAPPAGGGGVLIVGPRRAVTVAIAAAMRARGHAAAVDLGGPRRPEALIDYAREVGFTTVIVLDNGAAHHLAADSPGPGNPIAIPKTAVRAAVAGDAVPLLAALGLGAASSTRST